jgi:predicted esterase
MKYLILALIASLSISCSHTSVAPMVFDNTYNVLKDDSVAFNGKRIYLIHGFRGNSSSYTRGNLKVLTDYLMANGYQVITFNLPYTERYFFEDGGLAYRNLYKTRLEELRAQVDTDLGPAAKNIIGGFSFGGLHAMMGISITTGLFDSYLAMLPVTRINVLAEMSGINSDQFNPFFEENVLKNFSGKMCWGTADMRVDYRLTITLASDLTGLGANLDTTEFVGLGHDSSIDVINASITWFDLQ